MAKLKFPEIIHVGREGDDDDPNQFLAIYTDGVASLDRNGQEVAIYRRIKIGSIAIAKRFVEKRGSK